MRIKIKGLGVACGVFCSVVTLNASVVAITQMPCTTVIAPGVVTTITTGATMAGMTVQVIYDDSFTQTLTWAATSATAGGVTGASLGHVWSLAEDGDTYNTNGLNTNFWTLTNSATVASITDIIINGAPGFTVFDLISTPDTIGNEQTPNSARGFTFSIFGGNQASYNIAATYSNLLSLVGSPACNNFGGVGEPTNTPCGDTYGRLAFHFNTQTTGNPDQRGNILGPGQTFQFQADTDNIAPEPSTFALLGGGLLLAYTRLRRGNQLSRTR